MTSNDVVVETYSPNAEGVRGKFWLRTEKTGGVWTYTLRTMGNWADPYGIEVARFNSAVVCRYSGLAEQVVDALNNSLNQENPNETPL